ncbi:hypothetical protein SCMU_18310 [Sinomonas cyclohexanicum]|uniref:Uncharacterized protein n=1 Tax=Sinomonas cyclohexanicum TaxID=322009 RepID=A0ABN6FGH4_SINCY|nr:hypothetical protein [Corynebacterium cyclohexanicum]BCT75989.1 hypothetical protein SCMU_18310 [Corynebacterium cyclohexanicum]
MSDYATPRIFVRYITKEGDEWDYDYSEHAPQAGQFVYRNGNGYVVEEVWDIQDKHGPIPHGLTVFLKKAQIMAHRLGKYAPDYYRGEQPERPAKTGIVARD